MLNISSTLSHSAVLAGSDDKMMPCVLLLMQAATASTVHRGSNKQTGAKVCKLHMLSPSLTCKSHSQLLYRA